MNIVLDTNVLISGLLVPNSKPGQILQFVVSGYIRLCYDSRIFSEYIDVMNRTKFGFDKNNINDFFAQIKSLGKLVMPQPINLKFADSDDKKFLEVAVTAEAKYLVTGNTKHFPKSKYKNFNIITPADFIKKL